MPPAKMTAIFILIVFDYNEGLFPVYFLEFDGIAHFLQAFRGVAEDYLAEKGNVRTWIRFFRDYSINYGIS